MHRKEPEADYQPNIYKELNTSISMIFVQYNSCYMSKQEAFQVIPPIHFYTHSNLANGLCAQATKAE